MLAGLFKAPTKYSPNVNLPAARARANVVLDNLVDNGFMTEGQVFGARRHPATPVDRSDEQAPNYYLDWAFDQMKKLVDTFPKSMTERVFVVRTALDPNLQRAADLAVENSLRQYGQQYHANQAATVLMDTDGAVRAMVGGRDYGASQFNRATDCHAPARLLVQALRLCDRAGARPQAELDRGRRADLHRQLVPAQLRPPLSRRHDADPGAHPFDQHHRGAAVGHRSATAMPSSAAPRSSRPRMTWASTTPLPDTPSLPIGADGVDLLDHVGAYATFPNLGMKVMPHAILEVRTGNGKLIWR